MINLSQTAVLASFNAHAGKGGRRKVRDLERTRKLNEEENPDHAEANSVEVLNYLFPKELMGDYTEGGKLIVVNPAYVDRHGERVGNNHAYAKFLRHIGQMRALHYALCVMPYRRGQWILPTVRLQKHETDVKSGGRAQHQSNRQEAIEEWPRMIEFVAEKKNGTFNPAHYPSQDDIAAVAYDVSYDIIPAYNHIVTELASESLAQLQVEKEAEAKALAAKVVESDYLKLLKPLLAVMEMFANPDAKNLVKATVDNLLKAADIGIAFDASAEVQALTAQIKGFANAIDLDAVRKNADFRKDLGEQAKQLAVQFGELGKRAFSV